MAEEIAQQIIAKKKRGNPAWQKGVSGNPKGQPRKPEIELLRQALEKAKQENGIDFIEHFVKMAYKDKNVAIALAKKLIPDRLQGEGFASNNVTTFITGIDEGRIEGLRNRIRQALSSEESA